MNNMILSYKQAVCLLIMASGLFGCATQPANIQYYLLNVATIEDQPSDSQQHLIVIDTIVIPDFLKSRSLVMQREDLTLAVATKHVWAEALNDDFGAYLAKRLRAHQGIDSVYRGSQNPSRKEGNDESIVLEITIEHFMPISSGDVVLSGYWFNKKEYVSPFRFSYVLPLTEDGYSHSVSVMRDLIELLSSDIHRELTGNE